MAKLTSKRSFSAKTKGNVTRKTKKAINPTYGKKGSGWINDPKKAAYNKTHQGNGCLSLILLFFAFIFFLICL